MSKIESISFFKLNQIISRSKCVASLSSLGTPLYVSKSTACLGVLLKKSLECSPEAVRHPGSIYLFVPEVTVSFVTLVFAIAYAFLG